MPRSVFFGYPQDPTSSAQVLRTVAEAISGPDVDAITWQDLVVDGSIVINKVLEAIDDCDMAIFDITNPNPNVLFEAGYAIARGKKVWLTQDSTVSDAKAKWRDLAILKPIGYTSYRNSDELINRFISANPLDTLESLYDKNIEPALPATPPQRDSILYCTTFEPFEAANRLNAMMDSRRQRGLSLVVSDPSEASLSTLEWFARAVAGAAGVLVHFAGKRRNRAEVDNNRHAFVAGLAVGLEIPVLLLSEDDYPAPFDYEDRLRIYETAEECVEEAREWLSTIEFEGISWASPRTELRSSLVGIRFGEHVAENERLELPDYFLETAAYYEVIASRDSIFIGHRGTGKTANALQAFEYIAANKTNLAILIKPPGFEFPAMLAVIDRLPAFQHDYFFDALWRFVIQTEIASAVLQKLEARSRYVPYSQDEQAFLDYANSTAFDMRADMSVRLEQALDSLLESLPEHEVSGSARNLINEAFHDSALTVLRSKLGTVLKDRKRVAVFVDNLDKGWERGADFKVMARFILGLLTARGHVVVDFEKEDYWRDSIKLTVAIFLRSDIYGYLKLEAREPDKLPISTISWGDSETLRSVIENRFMLSEARPANTAELWTKYFCQTIAGEPLPDYFDRMILPRPRDIVFFCNTAIGRAIDRIHDSVTEEDFQAAQVIYSQYAYEALLVENGVTIPEMEDALLLFLEAPAIATRHEREKILIDGSMPADRATAIVTKLVSMSFFGIEVSNETFVYPDEGPMRKAAEARARRLQPDLQSQRLLIHPAFHAFLEVRE